MKAQPRASHYVNGRFVEDERGAPLEVVYPATGETIARLNAATPNIVELAVEAARAAQGEWARMRPAERGRILRRAADMLRTRNDELARLETLDTGKPIQETAVADPASAAEALEFFGGAVAAFHGDFVDFGGGPFGYTRREPLGVCVGIGAWNYPIQGAGWKSAPALAMGNAMVFKPSENTPLQRTKHLAVEVTSAYRRQRLAHGRLGEMVSERQVPLSRHEEAGVDARVEVVGTHAELEKQVRLDVASDHRRGLQPAAHAVGQA